MDLIRDISKMKFEVPDGGAMIFDVKNIRNEAFEISLVESSNNEKNITHLGRSYPKGCGYFVVNTVENSIFFRGYTHYFILKLDTREITTVRLIKASNAVFSCPEGTPLIN